MAEKHKKPPHGVKPFGLHVEDRIDELATAIKAYLDADRIVPLCWLAEYNWLKSKYDMGTDISFPILQGDIKQVKA